jgi:hypothetical protein
VNGGTATLSTRIVRVRLRELKLLEKNARFMGGAEFKQLVGNLKADGVLTSAPLVHKGVVLSGNHRVQAALEAGIEEADVIEVLGELDPQRQVALQLSHNAIVGKDDPGLLSDLYRDLDLHWKQYSGLTDEVFQDVKELDVAALALGQPEYQEILFLFLPEEADRFLKVLKGIQKKLDKGTPVMVGRFEDFDRFFEAIVAAKKVRGIHNSAVALRTIAEIALKELEGEAAKTHEAAEVHG